MAEHLRVMSVEVHESYPGVFHWVVAEIIGNSSCMVRCNCQYHYLRWDEALLAGVQELLALSGDRAIGPRSRVSDELRDY